MVSKNPPIHQLYRKYLLNKKNMENNLIQKCNHFWGNIPATIGESVVLAERLIKHIDYDSNMLEILKKEIKKNQKKLGILTRETEERIDMLHEGVIETGQQPNCLGGPGLVINKIMCSEKISSNSKMVPLFSVVDYDGVKSELINTRLPNLSKEGLLIQYPVSKNQLDVPISSIENPPEKWLKNTLQKIKENYKPLIYGHKQRETLIHNIDQIISLLKYSYYSSENVSELYIRIIGTILNLEGEANIPFYWYSMRDNQSIFQEAYEELLAEPTRTKFITTTNKMTKEITLNGFEPQRGLRNKDYVPFYLMCTKCRTRLNPHYIESKVNIATIKATCLECGESLEYSINPIKPDLSDIIDYVSPRVDTRQIIQNSVIPIVIRVGGSGENGYFAEVRPVATALKKQFPIFFHYTRMFYNSPWNTEKARNLNEKGYKTLESPSLFRSLGRWVEARNQEDKEKLMASHKMFQYTIFLAFRELVQAEKRLNEEINETRKLLHEQEDREKLLNDIKNKNKTVREINQYLSWAFGRNQNDSFGQEVTWNWIDLAAQIGIKEIVPLYRRLYHSNTPNSSIFYINT